MGEYIEMTYSEWVEKYRPLKDSYGDAHLFNSTGTDLEFLRKQFRVTIWTAISSGSRDYIRNDVKLVNRIGFYVTEIPWIEDDEIDVTVRE